MSTAQKLLNHPNIDVNMPTKTNKNTPLMVATIKHNPQMVELLLKCPNIDVHKSNAE